MEKKKVPNITRECVEEILDKKFLHVFDLKHTEGKHYYDATRRSFDKLVAPMTEEEFKKMLPDTVSCVVVLETPQDGPRLLLSYEFRYPTGRFLLGVPAGLIDPEDEEKSQPLLETAKREIFEETGLVVDDERDEIYVINPLLFSTPGMTDESNALVFVRIKADSTDSLTQKGAEGQECFDGFELLTQDKAREILRAGLDERGHFYSVYTWAALMYFTSEIWKKK